jgi:branched-chain amino acid aminotransferase
MSPFKDNGFVWMNGRFVPWKDAKIHVADEVFFTGSAAEITPIRSIDKIVIGSGKRGPVAKKLQEEFFAIVRVEKPDRFGWLTCVV